MLYFPTVEEAKDRQESAAESTSADDGRININTADAAGLMQIPGVGESRAEAILAYRREHGSFGSIEEIMKVSGIKNALFEKMKDYITI
jgi:competence protein ComEA